MPTSAQFTKTGVSIYTAVSCVHLKEHYSFWHTYKNDTVCLFHWQTYW